MSEFRGKAVIFCSFRAFRILTRSGHIDPMISPAFRLVSSIMSFGSSDVPDYVFFMHDDANGDESDWESYLVRLKDSGSFEGGSAIGNGVCVRKSGAVPALTTHLTGYIRVRADNLDHAKIMLAGNPHFESGGTVEIRELPRTD